MKKLILLLIICCATGYAQDTYFGVKAGLLSSSHRNYVSTGNNNGLFKYGDDGYGSSGAGVYVAGFADFLLVDEFRLQPEINLNIISDNTAMSIPVLLKVSFAGVFNVLAGPGLNFSFDANDNAFSPSIDFGGSYDFTDNFFADVRGDVGLSGYLRTNLMAGVGYKF